MIFTKVYMYMYNIVGEFMNSLREKILDINEKCLGEKYLFIPDESNGFTPVGQGGSGIVYAANQKFSEDTAVYAKRAIKFFAFRDDLVQDWGYVSKDNFDIEIENISRFNHQNILKVIDGNYYKVKINPNDTDTISIPYTVTEFIEGPNLEVLFKDENKELCMQIFRDEEAVFLLLAQIINGIDYLHNNSFYHCDIAPKNIFVKSDADGEFLAVIGDLGAGKTIHPKKFSTTRVIGTWGYMPNNVQKIKNTEITYDDFCTLQPSWDIFSTVKTLKEIIENIKSCDCFKFDYWNLDRLYEKLSENSYSSISDIAIDIEHLRPTSNQIFRLDELSEASKSIGQVLLPINSAYLSRRMRKLSKHDMLLRLMDVPQLLEGATTFPGANHTRYEHSLGTYELMRKAMLALLRNKEYAKFLSEKYVIIGLLSALLSSLSNFPYSYAINELQTQEKELFDEITPRKLFHKLVNLESIVSHKSIVDCIDELFGEYKINISDIEYVIFGKESKEARNKALEVLNYILNSSVGVRIVDYMMRDSHHIGLTYKIDTDDLFKSMSIIDSEFCLRQPGITSAEQIITNRYWLFKRIYWSDPNRANAALLKHIFFTVNNNEFVEDLSMNFHNASKKDIQAIILNHTNEYNSLAIKCSIDQLNLKGQKRYKSILVLDKNSGYSHSNEICKKFAGLTYSKQHTIRNQIEHELIIEYDISEISENYGPLVLIDMPNETPGNKLGDDIRILRYDKSSIPLTKASGIVSGLKTAFEDQLMLLRVFLRPDINEKLDEKFGRKEIEKFLCEKLYEIL